MPLVEVLKATQSAYNESVKFNKEHGADKDAHGSAIIMMNLYLGVAQNTPEFLENYIKDKEPLKIIHNHLGKLIGDSFFSQANDLVKFLETENTPLTEVDFQGKTELGKKIPGVKK